MANVAFKQWNEEVDKPTLPRFLRMRPSTVDGGQIIVEVDKNGKDIHKLAKFTLDGALYRYPVGKGHGFRVGTTGRIADATKSS